MNKENIISFPEDPYVQEEILNFIKQPFTFEDFIDIPLLKDDDISLVCIKKSLPDPIRKWVPAYHFSIYLDEVPIGSIDLRIGYNEGLYYGGNIGYSIDEEFRGHGYAPRACKLVSLVAKGHNMKSLNISNEYSNFSSFRVCEKIGAKFIRTIKLPEYNDMRKDGNEYENIFVWNLE